MNIIPKKWLSVNLLRKKAHGNQFCKIKKENLEIRRGAACCSRFLLLSNCIFSGGASPSPTILLILKVCVSGSLSLRERWRAKRDGEGFIFISFALSATPSACHRLTAVRSRLGFDSHSGCHSLPRRRFATQRWRL